MEAGTSVYLKDGETVHDLQRDGLRIIQGDAGSRFGMDAVLLSSYAMARPGETVMDLCSGSGVIPILMYAKNPGAAFWGIELLENLTDMAARSVALNGIMGKLTILQGDVRRVGDIIKTGVLKSEGFDVVTVNPPYLRTVTENQMWELSGQPDGITARNIARSEICCAFVNVAAAAGKLLRFGGRMYMIHRTDRLTDVLCGLRDTALEPKCIRFVQPTQEKPAALFLLKAVKGAARGLVMEPPLIVRDADGAYTPEFKGMYDA